MCCLLDLFSLPLKAKGLGEQFNCCLPPYGTMFVLGTSSKQLAEARAPLTLASFASCQSWTLILNTGSLRASSVLPNQHDERVFPRALGLSEVCWIVTQYQLPIMLACLQTWMRCFQATGLNRVQNRSFGFLFVCV